MRGLVCSLLLVSLGCQVPEMPKDAPRTATVGTMPERVVPPPPPLPPKTWSVDLKTFGGFSGRGKGWIDVSSDRAASPCSSRIPEEKWLALETAVAAAQPQEWRERYQPARFRQTDAFSYSLGLNIEEDGKKTRYVTSWQDNSADQIPPDLRALYLAAGDIMKDCR